MNSVKSVGPPTANPFGDPELPSAGTTATASRQTSVASKSDTKAQNEKVATELEAYFMRTVMAETRGNTDSQSLDGGFAGGTFREMLDGALTDKMAAGQGMGLKKVIIASLERAQKDEAAGGKVSPAIEQARRITSHSAVDAIAAHRALKEP